MAECELIDIGDALPDTSKGAGVQTALDLMQICAAIGKVRGTRAVLSGLVTALVNIAHLSGEHAEACDALRMAIQELENPARLQESGLARLMAERLRGDVAGRA